MGGVIAGEDRAALLRVARSCARAPVAESRLAYDAERAEVAVDSGTSEGPYAGVHRMNALECIARWLEHVPERYETRVRYYGAYATRRRVWWQRRGIVLVGAAPAAPGAAEPAADWPALRARRRRLSGTAAARPPGRGRGVPGLRRCDADRRVHHRARGRAAHPRASRARWDRRARRTLGGRGAGTRLSAGGAWRAAGEERAPEGGREHAASGRATGRVRVGGTRARRGSGRRPRNGSARGAGASSNAAWRSARASSERESDGEECPGGRTLRPARMSVLILSPDMRDRDPHAKHLLDHPAQPPDQQRQKQYLRHHGIGQHTL